MEAKDKNGPKGILKFEMLSRDDSFFSLPILNFKATDTAKNPNNAKAAPIKIVKITPFNPKKRQFLLLTLYRRRQALRVFL